MQFAAVVRLLVSELRVHLKWLRTWLYFINIIFILYKYYTYTLEIPLIGILKYDLNREKSFLMAVPIIITVWVEKRQGC